MANPASISIASGSGNTVTEVLQALDSNANPYKHTILNANSDIYQYPGHPVTDT
jgi:hypothetical protein